MSIRGSVFSFRVFRVFRGSIRAHSCPFVVLNFPFVFFVFFVVPPTYSCPFVSIRGSDFPFRAIRVFRGSTPVFRGSIRIHSWL